MRFRKLSEIAPSGASPTKPAPDETVWHLTLDQIESGSGKIGRRSYGRASDAGTSTFAFDTGNVLYSKLRPYLNKVICPDRSGIATSELVPLRPIPEELNREFLCFYLRSPEFVSWASAQVDGAKMPRMKMKSFWAHEMPLPPLDDQIRIARLLGKVEGLIAQRKQHLQQLDDLLKSIFLEMFGDPVRNEKGWEPTTIGQIIKVASGNGLVAKDMNTEGPYKVYGGNGVNGTHTEYMFDSPTLVIGRVGYYCGSVHITEPKSWVTDNALYVKEFLKKTDLVFIKHLLATHDLNKAAGRAAQPLVSGSRIYPIHTIDVPYENQKSFSTIVERVEALKSRYQHSLTNLESLYGALSQQAFKGELDLSRVALPAASIEVR